MVKAAALVAMLLVVMTGLPFLSCVGQTTRTLGWSGSVISNGVVYVGSTHGKLVGLNITDGSRQWEAALNGDLPSSGGIGCATPPIVTAYGTPAVSGEYVYIGSYIRSGNNDLGKIYAFKFGRSEPRWIYPRQGTLSSPIIGGPVVAGGKVYIGSSDGQIYALNAEEGFKEWTFQTGDAVWSTPVLEGNTLFVASFDGKLYALNAATGEKRWEFKTDGAIATAPTVHNGTAYIGSFDRYLYAVDAATGGLKWRSAFIAGKWYWASPVVYRDVIYAACLDNKVYAVNASTGEKIAESDLGSPISSSPVLIGGTVVFASEDGKIWSINASNNEAKMLTDLKETTNAPLSFNDGTIYVHTEKDVFYALNAQTGTVLWKLSLGTT